MFVFVSDYFVEDYAGGGELTTSAIIQGSDIPIKTIRSSNLSKEIVQQLNDHHWVFGNFSQLSLEMVVYCCKNLQYSVIEYVYKYCKYRLPEKHIAAEGFCNCENEIIGKAIAVFYSKARDVWFMSDAQRQIYLNKIPALKKQKTYVLSSVFTKETIDYIKSLDCTSKNDTWLIQKSPSWVKGTDAAISYAQNNNLKYELFSDLEYGEMLKKFSNYKGFIFLPNGSDTCPRTVIEAKMLGCELVLNNNVQHKEEEWFSGNVDGIINYLDSRASFFWDAINEHTRARKKENIDKKTHFKIVVPVYNSEDWISKTLQSVLSQKYTNYQCIVCNDVSTDNTKNVIESLELDERFSIIDNTEKKYALKNIDDAIRYSNPAPEDVIVVLDGDDWLATSNVLETLSSYYSDGALVTFGSFVRFPDGNIGQESSEYPDSIIEKNEFRQDTWRASHLKTFKNSLWLKVNKDDLKDVDGNYYEVSYDQAMMLPLLEMAGDRAKYIPEILYVYNLGNPNAVNKTKAKKQYQTMLEIRKKQKYTRI